VMLTGIAAGGRGVALTTDRPTTAELRTALADLFLASGASIAHRMQQLGLPPLTGVELSVIERERNGPGSWGVATRKETLNTLTVGWHNSQGAPWLPSANIIQARNCASMLVQVSATLPFWGPLSGSGDLLVERPEDHTSCPSYDDDPLEWATRQLVLPALWWHLCALPHTNIRDASKALAFADEVIQVALDEHLWYRVFAPLSGMVLQHSSDKMTDGDISIRSISDAEQGEWFMQYSHTSGRHLMGSEPPQVVLEVRVPGPRKLQHTPVGGLAPSLLLAFQLHRYDIAGSYAPEHSDPRWIHSFAYHVPITLPGRTKNPQATPELAPSEFRAVTETARLLAGYNILQPQSPRDLALHRFALGTARSNAADALLDFTIALEALLLPDDSRGDLGYRFRIHGGHYLAREPHDREGIAEKLQEIYKMRSRFVHGGKYPDQVRISATRDTAREFIRRGLLRAVHEGFPNSETFAQMALGITAS
jgi:Apea-like HEPN